ncbi:hypothetical protein LCGC14_2798930, partial [marine sediment metagenome]
MMVVFLGTDGSGKSSVIHRLSRELSDEFQGSHYVHLRPGLGRSTRNEGQPVTDPHANTPRSYLGSVVKAFYLLFDYTVGYFIKIRPLRRSSLVLFDRYYHDMLVDPRRYRYGGPSWLARWVGTVIPKPDIFILLDAPAEVLYARKKEVAFEEVVRQRDAYLNLVRSLSNGY